MWQNEIKQDKDIKYSHDSTPRDNVTYIHLNKLTTTPSVCSGGHFYIKPWKESTIICINNKKTYQQYSTKTHSIPKRVFWLAFLHQTLKRIDNNMHQQQENIPTIFDKNLHKQNIFICNISNLYTVMVHVPSPTWYSLMPLSICPPPPPPFSLTPVYILTIPGLFELEVSECVKMWVRKEMRWESSAMSIEGVCCCCCCFFFTFYPCPDEARRAFWVKM